MIPQGAALQPRDLKEWNGDARAVLLSLLLRLILLPVLVMLLAKALVVALDIDRFAGTGLILAFAAPAAAAGLPLAAIAGGAVPLYGRLAAVSTVASAFVGSFFLATLVMQAPVEAAFVMLLALVILPFGIGLALRERLAQLGRLPAVLASLVTALLLLAVLLLGWTVDALLILLAMALLLVAALAVTLLCARLLRLPGESLVSLCLSVLIPVAAVPMALGLMAGAPSVAFAGAAYAVLGYLLAFLLIGARLRRARRR